MLKVYEYPKCSTCKKALAFLEKKKAQYQKIDITEQPPTLTELKKMLAVYEGDLKRLFNTSGVQYRELRIKEKLPKMTEASALALLSKNGKLVKRPFVLDQKKGAVGFREEEWKQFLR